MSTQRVWFVTGASSGFGKLLTELVLSKGERVVATLRKPEVLDELKVKYSSNKLLVLKLDVSKPEDITAAFDKTKEVFGRLDVVFNNAGHSMIAEVEGTPEDAARRMFDINFWGAANVNKEAVRFFRDVNRPGQGGRLIVTSSMCAISPVPSVGFYSATKYAIDGLTNGLASELDPEWNIKITLLEPGSFDTNGRASSSKFPPHPAYTKPTLSSAIFRAMLGDNMGRRGDTGVAVERIYDLVGLADPPLRLVMGHDAYKHARAQYTSLVAELDKYESWSNGLQPGSQ